MVHGPIPCQWGESFVERMHSRRRQELYLLAPSQRDSQRLQPVLRHYKDSIALTGLHPTSTTNSATSFMGRNIFNVCRAFRTMKWSGLLIIWTGCVVTSPFPALRLIQHRFSLISILQVSLQGSAYRNSEAYAVPGKRSRHRTHFRPTSVLIPNRSPPEVIVVYTRGPSVT